MGFLAACRFLTIIPLPDVKSGNPLPYFPLVGLAIGLTLLGSDYGLRLVLDKVLVDVFLIIFLIVITGGLHIEGFMDTCDGVFAVCSSPQERLRIMADSRVGGFGVVGAFSLLLTKYASLSALPGELRGSTLILMPVIGRWTMVYAIFSFPAAKKEGLGYSFKKQANWQSMAIATAITSALAIALFKLTGIVLMASLSLTTFGIASYLRSRLGGLNGDTYGAINELSEAFTLLFLPLIMRDVFC